MINTLPQFVAQVVGDIRINRPAIKARPAEDADKALASIREGLIRAIEHDSDATDVYANAGQNQVGCGIGNFQAVIDYASDDVFDRDIKIKAIPDPFAVVWDCMRTDPTGRDAGHCFVLDDMERKAFERRYPDKAPSSLGSDFEGELQRSGWVNRDTVRIANYWVMKDRPAEIAMLQDGSIKELTKENREALLETVLTNSRGQPMIRKTKRKVACVYRITGFDLLEDPVEHDLDRIPVFRVPGWEINTGEKTKRWGLVRFAKDATRLRNYWRSVMAEKLALAPRQQWLIHESQAGDQDDFRNAANNGDTVLTWNGQIEPKRLDPPQIEAALMQEAALNAQDIKDVTGLHDASLGARSNETSGKAIMARQREGDVANYIYHDNLKAAIKECGRVVNQYIPQVFDTARTIRVLGEDEQQNIQRVNDPNDPESIDLGKGKYDIVVETGPSYSTKRVEAAESMMQFVQAVPTAAQVASDLIAKAQDWPLAEEIGERLKKTLPPGMVEEDDKDISPQEAQRRQQASMQAQQQQQLQEQAVMLELADKEADVMKKRAEAQKIQAETGMSGQPTEDPRGAELDVMLKVAQVRKAEADAAKAEAEAMLAQSQVNAPQGEPINVRKELAETSKAEAEAQQAHIQTQADLMDLQNKPREQEMAHKQADKALKEPPKTPAKPKA